MRGNDVTAAVNETSAKRTLSQLLHSGINQRRAAIARMKLID
jgi:hypothetical protein